MADFLNASGTLYLQGTTNADGINFLWGNPAGTSIGDYRGTTWHKADSTSGTFPATGNLAMSYFYGKGPTAAAPPYSSSNYDGTVASAVAGSDNSKPGWMACTFKNDGSVTFTIGGPSEPSWELPSGNPGTKLWLSPGGFPNAGTFYYIRRAAPTTLVEVPVYWTVDLTEITTSWQTIGSGPSGERAITCNAATGRNVGDYCQVVVAVDISLDAVSVLYTGTITMTFGVTV